MNRSIRSISSQMRQSHNGFSSTFYVEISNIMHGCGDCQNPLEESVILMEKIIKQQLSCIIKEALKISKKSSDSTHYIDHKDIVFLMRKNPSNIMRVLKFLKDLHSSKKLENRLNDEEVCVKDETITLFINEMTELYNLPENLSCDETRRLRLERADRLSKKLNTEQYLAYTVARQTTFCNNSTKSTLARARLLKWLVPNNDVQFSPTGLQILGFLLHETVARLIDTALLIRYEQGLEQCIGIRPIAARELNEAVRRYSCKNSVTFERHSFQSSSPIIYVTF